MQRKKSLWWKIKYKYKYYKRGGLMETLFMTIQSAKTALSAVCFNALFNKVWGVITFLVFWIVGDAGEAVLAMFSLLILDIITKLFSTVKIIADERDVGYSEAWAIAWMEHKLNSKKLSTGTIGKIIAYGAGILVGKFLANSFQGMDAFGYSISTLPRDIIIAMISVTEAVSVCENLSQAGYPVFGKIGMKFQSDIDDQIKVKKAKG